MTKPGDKKNVRFSTSTNHFVIVEWLQWLRIQLMYLMKLFLSCSFIVANRQFSTANGTGHGLAEKSIQSVNRFVYAHRIAWFELFRWSTVFFSLQFFFSGVARVFLAENFCNSIEYMRKKAIAELCWSPQDFSIVSNPKMGTKQLNFIIFCWDISTFEWLAVASIFSSSLSTARKSVRMNVCFSAVQCLEMQCKKQTNRHRQKSEKNCRRKRVSGEKGAHFFFSCLLINK